MPGTRTVCYVEGEAYAAAQLAARMADETMDAAPVWSDVKSFDPEPWRGCVDIITAGYPCQPFSIAGAKRAEKDPRHLWPFIREIVRTIEPRICFFENVSHHLRLGFEQVHDDLRSMGFSVAAGLFTAEEVGAPHKRERLFILAYSESFFSKRCFAQRNSSRQSKETLGKHSSNVANNYGHRFCCEQRPSAGKDDPQRRSQCAENTITGGNSHAAGRLPLHETGSSSAKSGQGLSDGQSAVADTARARAGIDQCNSWIGIGGDSTPLADPSCNRKRRKSRKLPKKDGRPDGQSSQFAHGTDQGMADPCSAGLERQPRHERAPEWTSIFAKNGLPVWPPAPGGHEQWGHVPDALKPAVHRMADGMANRVDRLRACGNGVVPLVAAYAFRTLYPFSDE
ncbi:MAG TPA: DNA cytosine methyltransferase [Alphaproteobacteria bacterium]|nr:DNA cytosine methyltransferase [Alphaproteobacteria bacterium]